MIPLVLFLLACMAVYVGTIQAAFSALVHLSLRLQAEREGRSARLEAYLEDPASLFIPIRLVLGLIVVLAGELFARLIGIDRVHSLVLLFVAVTAFLVISEHLIPQIIVRRGPQDVLEVLLPSFDVVALALRPVTKGLRRIAHLGPRDRDRDDITVVDATPTDLVEDPAETLADNDRELLKTVVEFRDTIVREVMTPRPHMVAIRSDATLETFRAVFREQEYSRIPVYHETLDDIRGIVFAKDLIKRGDLPGDTPVTSLMRDAYFVPETKRVADLLREFQRHRVQSAIVVNEYGSTVGIVSLEDLLEELVGEIRDEDDVETEPFTEQPDGSLLVAGAVNLDELGERLELEIPHEGFETVAGLLLAHSGRVPAVGDHVDIGDLAFDIVEADRQRVVKVRVRRLYETPSV